ncbi:hypothetical protein HPB50_021925 [Hyalomma asiaticum]|uniref:Uncharacterized protein n=1 Tax=Hyalomma asiaticum TaxID=266040 RepID=A0ACB7T3D4_HYAAI|nr:hypothetical protein HPB50_021925 [Hyalomma asiaticum]
MLQSHRDKIQSQGAIVDKLAKLCKEQEEIIKKQNENIEKLTRLFQEQLLSKQPAPNLTKEEIEAVVEAKIVSVIETKLAALVGSHLTTLVEPKSTAIVESRLEAIVDTKLEPVTIQIGNTFTTLNRAMDTHTAQINELKSQLTNFIAHVKNNCISHADLENLPGRKKPRTQSKKASRSNSPERENTNDPETNTEKVRLSGYKTLSITRRTATLLKKNFTAQEHKIEVKTGTARLTEWNAFRSELDHDTAINDIDVWLKNVTHQREHIRLLTHNYDGSEEDLLKKLCEKLRGPTQPVTTLPSFKEYEGLPNADLDRPFTLAELHGAIAKLTRNTSPGKDRIVNKHLRQLPNKALTALLQYYNECWDKGELPASWKHSEVIMGPYEGKTTRLRRSGPVRNP